jgi:hypothetical protein
LDTLSDLMQTLGLAESTPRTESRLKSLFWPTVKTAVDVDYLGVQGFWVCVIVACLSLAIFLLASQILMAIAVFGFFFLGGVGVREHSRFAAGIMFVYYVLNLLVGGFSVLQIIILALFLSNLRATWIASRWKPDSDEAEAPPRMGDTWADKFSDRLPQWLWPNIRLFYYIYSVGTLTVFGLGVLTVAGRRFH